MADTYFIFPNTLLRDSQTMNNNDGSPPPGRHHCSTWPRSYGVPSHPCLEKRRRCRGASKKDNNNNNSNDARGGAGAGSCVSFRNFAMDSVTLAATLQALRSSPGISALEFHGAGLSAASVRALVDSLPATAVSSLSLDFNAGLAADSSLAANADGADLPPGQRQEHAAPVFAGLVGGGSRLRALSLRGNGIGDEEAAALAERLQEDTALCSLNLFHNAVTDAGWVAGETATTAFVVGAALALVVAACFFLVAA